MTRVAIGRKLIVQWLKVGLKVDKRYLLIYSTNHSKGSIGPKFFNTEKEFVEVLKSIRHSRQAIMEIYDIQKDWVPQLAKKARVIDCEFLDKLTDSELLFSNID